MEVTLVRTTDGACIRYEDRSGAQRSECGVDRGYYYGDTYSYQSTCVGVDAQRVCQWSYDYYYSSGDESCVNASGDYLSEDLYCDSSR